MLTDLHTHTTASDGSLAPADLLEHARAAGIAVLAITDHDTTNAYTNLDSATCSGLDVVHGVEFSTVWQRRGIHVVGLNVRIDSDAMVSACASQMRARDERAHIIAAGLHKRGIADAYDGAAALADGDNIGRPHFARYLVSIGAVATPAQAFKKFLGGKHHAAGLEQWASLEQVIDWIRGAGGNAVLAHPAKYGLTRSRLNALTRAFRDLGGEAIEVISGSQHADVTTLLSRVAESHGLAASLGSDFHQPGLPWAALGRIAPLPEQLQPVWDLW